VFSAWRVAISAALMGSAQCLEMRSFITVQLAVADIRCVENWLARQ